MKQGFSEILLSLYGSLGPNLSWDGFLGNLSAYATASGALLVLQDQAGQAAVYGMGALPLSTDQMMRMRYLRTYSPDDFTAAVPFRALRTRVLGGGEAWVILWRETGDLSASLSVLLGDLAPHIAQAVPQFWAAQQTRAKEAAMADLAQRAGVGWALITGQGAVIAVHNAPPAYVQNARLRLPSADQQHVLAAAEKGRIVAIALSEIQGLYVPMAAFGGQGILYFATHRTFSAGQEPLLQQLFGLTRAESRFAARLAAGDSIEQAGAALSFTAQTARYYSKQVYSKLGVAGLPSAVLALSNSVYRLV